MFEPIAIIGMGGIFPDALDLSEYWSNIVSNKCLIREINEEIWNIDDFYDPDPNAEDKTYCKKAAAAPSISFNPMEFGMSPKVMQSTAVEQLYGLAIAKRALADASMLSKEFDHERTGIIVSASVGKPLFRLCHRTETPKLRRILKNVGMTDDKADLIIRRYKDSLDEWSESSNPGTLSNVVAGRIANRFDLKGTSCCVDAACASGLAAVKLAIDELQNHNNDIMLAGGVNLDLSPNTFLSFSKTPALSKSNKITPFDAGADGMLLGDGAGMIVMKRLSDAEKDNDNIYAVIKGAGSSSDGCSESIYAPSKKGQQLAIRRAWDSAGISGDTIGLFEAHGTGTAVGDKCELEALNELLPENRDNVVIGSVKGQIGHLRLAAGIASMIKTVIALNNKVLPPSVPVSELNPAFKNSPMRPIDKALPWITSKDTKRRAAVSAFGFGGTNYHIVLEEYISDKERRIELSTFSALISGADTEEIISRLYRFIDDVNINIRNSFKSEYSSADISAAAMRLGFVGKDREELVRKAQFAIEALKSSKTASLKTAGVFFRTAGLYSISNTAVMFPGQGTQCVNAVSALAAEIPYITDNIGYIDDLLTASDKKKLSETVYPIDNSTSNIEQCGKLLNSTEYTQLFLAGINGGIYSELRKRGINAGYYFGHSYGEIMALSAAGYLSDDELFKLSYARGDAMKNNSSDGNGMLAVMADHENVLRLMEGAETVCISNVNSPQQLVVAGKCDELDKIAKKADEQGIRAVRLNVSNAFHTEYMSDAKKAFNKYISSKAKFREGERKVLSNIDAEFYSSDKKDIITKLSEQIVSPVQFRKCVEKAYNSGVRIFIEAGVGSVLSNMVKKILTDKDDIEIVTICPKNVSTMYNFEEACINIAVLGLPVSLKKISDESSAISTGKKGDFIIDPQYFYLKDKKTKMNEAVNKKENIFTCTDKANEKNMENKYGDTHCQKEDGNMNKDIVIDLQQICKGAFEMYMRNQNEKMNSIVGLIDSLSEKNSENCRYICDFAEKSMSSDAEVFKEFLKHQEKLISIRDEMPAYSAPESEKIVTSAVLVPVRSEPISVSDISVAEQSEEAAEDNGILKAIIDVVCDITGFDEDIIEADMDLKNDLGFDSIQIVDFYSTLSERLNYDNNVLNIDELSGLSTINDIYEYLISKK